MVIDEGRWKMRFYQVYLVSSPGVLRPQVLSSEALGTGSLVAVLVLILLQGHCCDAKRQIDPSGVR